MDAAQDSLARLGARLRDAGLSSRALAAWAGASRIAAIPVRLAAIAARPATPADAMLALFVAGDELDAGRLRLPAVAIDELVAHALIERRGDRVRACVTIVPLGRALMVCDRLDAPVERDRVSWPDDSSHHLASAVPAGRRAHWLDLACGSAYAPLARPELAAQIAAVDLNARAVGYAELGARLSGIAHVTCSVADIGATHAPADLVTCNAPIPPPRTAAGGDASCGDVTPGAPAPARADRSEIWRHAEHDFFDRMWPALRRAVCADGMIVLHAAHDALEAGLRPADGERVLVTYTPDDVRAFAVAWWRPDAPSRFVASRRMLTVERPHVDPADREAALARG